jgi:nucleoside-diphosphate-sugar epimerase
MSKTIFITGGTGFVGSYIIRYLLRDYDYKIRVLKRKNSPMDLVQEVKDKVEWIEGDLLDTVSLEDAMQDVDEVYHCGALISFEPKHFKKMHRINEEGTANVVNIALDLGVKKLIHLSSIAALGRYKHISHYDENTKWDRSHLNSQYAISKHMAEQEVWRGIAEGLNAVIVNPSVIIGSGIWGSGTTTFFEQVWKGLRFYPGGATGFVDVRDVANFSVQLMESDISKERFVLNSENWAYRELFTEIAKAFDKNPPSIKTNGLMNAAAWRGDWLLSKITGKNRLITKEIITHISQKYTYGSSKSKSVLDFNYIPTLQTLAETCLQYLNAKKENNPSSFLPLL